MTATPYAGLARPRESLERLLGLVEAPTASAGPSRVQVSGGLDGRATWLVDRDWRVFAEPARALLSGGQEIAQFELAGAETLSASFDPARNAVFVPFSPDEAYVNYLTEAWKGQSPKRGLSAGQLNAFYRVKRFIPGGSRSRLDRCSFGARACR